MAEQMTSGSSGIAEGSVHSYLRHMRWGRMLTDPGSMDVFDVWSPSMTISMASTSRCTTEGSRVDGRGFRSSDCGQVISSEKGSCEHGG